MRLEGFELDVHVLKIDIMRMVKLMWLYSLGLNLIEKERRKVAWARIGLFEDEQKFQCGVVILGIFICPFAEFFPY